MPNNYSNEVDYDYLFKILLIGDSGVGKTAIVQRFSQDSFSTDYIATIGVDFQIRTIDVDSKRCKIQVWDTAGQDRFRSVVSSFYRGAHGVIICFDTTDSQSFASIDSWLVELRKYCSDQTPVFIVGTKSDLVSKRTVFPPTIQEFVDKRGLSYIETSSKTNENIENCFAEFTRMLVSHTNQLQSPQDNNTKGKEKIDIGRRIQPDKQSKCLKGKCNS